MKFITKTTESEIFDAMAANFESNAYEFTNENKHLKALTYISKAAEILENAGLITEAEMLTDYVEIFSKISTESDGE